MMLDDGLTFCSHPYWIPSAINSIILLNKDPTILHTKSIFLHNSTGPYSCVSIPKTEPFPPNLVLTPPLLQTSPYSPTASTILAPNLFTH